MAETKKTTDAKADAKDTATVADAKSTAGVNAGSDEAGTLQEVTEAQESGKVTEEPAAAYSSGFTVEGEAAAQRAIKKQADELERVNKEREAAAKDDEAQAVSALDRVARLEKRQDQIIAALLAMEEKRPVDREALERAREA